MTGMIKRIRKNNNLLIVYHNVKDHTKLDGGVRAWSIVAISFCISIIKVGGALFLATKKNI